MRSPRAVRGGVGVVPFLVLALVGCTSHEPPAEPARAADSDAGSELPAGGSAGSALDPSAPPPADPWAEDAAEPRADEPLVHRPPLPATSAAVRADDLKAHVDVLADDAFQGRHARGPYGRAAADYVARAFASLGLEPLGPDGTYFLDAGEGLSPNVAGRLAGEGERAWLVTAHYDHLAPRRRGEDRVYNGADDNASGVAVVLEVAEALAHGASPRPTVVFVAFSAEELDLAGSRAFVRSPPLALASIAGVINLDMVSRGREDLLFGEVGPGAEDLRERALQVSAGLGVELRFGEHPGWIQQSDHFPFVEAGVPAMYFGVEDHEDYHRVSDHAEAVLPELMRRVAELVLGILASA